MNMENNTLLSHELEDMRSQIGILKEKLEKQTIVNEQHIRRSMKSKMSDLTRIVAITIFAGVFALVYSTWFFWSQSLSPAFIVATAVMLVICIALTILQRVRLKSMDFLVLRFFIFCFSSFLGLKMLARSSSFFNCFVPFQDQRFARVK